MTPKTTSKTPMGDQLLAISIPAVFLGCIGFLVWVFSPPSYKYPLLYALEYNTDSEKVHYDKEPVDCDWGHAPIGDKDCHYERHVSPKYAGDGTVTDVFVTWEKLPN